MDAKESTAREHVRPSEGEPSAPTAVLRFKHRVAGSGISQSGHIRPGGGLIVEYDAARLPPSSITPGAACEIVCHARFHPGGERYSGAVVDLPGVASRAKLARHELFRVRVPTLASRVELW